MYKNLRWKVLVILAVAGLSVASFYPPGDKLRLGLDLQGGLELILRVKTDDALRLETETTYEQLRVALQDQGITVQTAADGLSAFTVTGVAPDKDAAFRSTADAQVSQVFDRESRGSGTYRFTMRPNLVVQTRESAVQQAIQTIDRRVNELGVSESTIGEYGSSGEQIIVQLPGLRDVQRAKDLIGRTALLELKIVESGPAPDQATLLSAHNGVVPPDMEVVPGSTGNPADPGGFFLVRRVAAVTGNDLRNARPSTDPLNLPMVSFTLNSQGASKFYRVTSENIGRQLAIVLDNRVVSAPVIEGAISADGQITGSFTQQEVQDLALVLRSGALPASLDYLTQHEVGPTLGADSIRAGIVASLTGLALVTLFMLVYYKLAGINAFVSVGLNLVILLGFMAYLDAVMTLPGIAGFILTIGMGVDSNVLIFERIREELATKKGARQAVAAGFDRVFVTIVDTHVASLIAAAFLFQFGTGPIRGFATTLFFGLVANVFTAVFVSRTIFEFILSRKPAGAAQISI
jgi:preprotein translocase subunit SecD